jgi:hypothetical protein
MIRVWSDEKKMAECLRNIINDQYLKEEGVELERFLGGRKMNIEEKACQLKGKLQKGIKIFGWKIRIWRRIDLSYDS